MIRIIQRFAPKEACRYLLFSYAAAILTPLGLYLIEACICCVEQGDMRGFAWSFTGLALCFFAGVVAEHEKRIADAEFTEAMVKQGEQEVIRRLCRIRYSWFEDARAADTMSRMKNSPMGAVSGVCKKAVDCSALVIRLLGTALLYFRLSVLLGAALIAVLTLQVILGIFEQREANRLYMLETPLERKMAYAGSILYEKASVFDCKVNHTAGYIRQFQERLAALLLKDRVKINLRSERYSFLSLLLMLAWSGAFIACMAAGAGAGVAAYAVLMGAYAGLIGYQNTLSYYLSSIGGDFLAIRAYKEFMSFEEEEEDLSDGKGSDRTNADAGVTVEFDHVSFTYPGTEKAVLKDVCFRIEPGDVVALAGENGSGKSTLIKLMCGLYRPTEGVIRANGKDISGLTIRERQELFRTVFQDFQCYSMTLRENVGLGCVSAMEDDERIREALAQAGAGELTEELPKDCDTVLNHLEEGGVSLSGGQWQRLAIARANMSRAGLLLLDEPTASMDPVAESRLYHRFTELFRRKGAVLVSHRLASARLADRILVLEAGRLIQSGTHESLMAQEEGAYRRMFTQQASWYQQEGGSHEQG